ncbi:restriction system modified-DNA reader domain-containing protein [Streptoalloteichus hindustanus]|uniref:restriction system modified-DNA reader domain-containing protein n=1 Tax=Streptoalloteichus hindustanus TaxID=2017 RepID=UPI00389A03C3
MAPTRLVAVPVSDSRRENIRDLVEAELIAAGDRLRLTRPRSGEEHVATVSPDGCIVLANRREYLTPSDAARAVTNR